MTDRAPLSDARDDMSTLSPTSSVASAASIAHNARQRDVIRYISFASAILSCLCAGSLTAFSLYGHLFQERLQYTQLQVNIVSIAAELGMYLPVPFLGYLCDRKGPAPLSFAAAILFGAAYMLAAFTYRSGALELGKVTHEQGWLFVIMVIAFGAVGVATACMYLSAVTTCAKNFGRGNRRGLALACPIAAFGLSGMWQSQVGCRLLYEKKSDGTMGDVDVFKYFMFLSLLLLLVGLLGTVGLKVVDEEGLIDEAVEELERGGLLEDSDLFRRATNGGRYGSFAVTEDGSENGSASARHAADAAKAREVEEARKKRLLLNEETRRFLKDHTMWWFAAGFFLVIGPGEAFINNLGTIIGTLYPPPSGASLASLVPTTAATHISIVGITSTIARLFAGTLTDFLAPVPAVHHYRTSRSNSFSSVPPPRSGRFTVSRIVFLLTFAFLSSLGQILLASGLIQNHAERFWIVSTLIGSGYGAVFSLAPIIITVIWGVENFGTNWGIVVLVPALGATVWGIVYSNVYQWAASEGSYRGSTENGWEYVLEDVLCYGKDCYSSTFWAMAVGAWIACALWIWAWKGKDGWSKRGIAI